MVRYWSHMNPTDETKTRDDDVHMVAMLLHSMLSHGLGAGRQKGFLSEITSDVQHSEFVLRTFEGGRFLVQVERDVSEPPVAVTRM